MLSVRTKINDLEQPKRTFGKKSFYRAHQKNLNEDRPILSVAECRSMILVSKNIRLFTGVPWEGTSKDSRVVDDDISWLIRWLLFLKLWR